MPVDEDLHGGVRDVPLATNHIGDTHGDIVNNDSEIVQGKTIGAHDHWIANGVRVERNTPTDQIIVSYRLIAGHEQTPDWLPSFSLFRSTFLWCQSETAARILVGDLVLIRLLALAGKFL